MSYDKSFLYLKWEIIQSNPTLCCAVTYWVFQLCKLSTVLNEIQKWYWYVFCEFWGKFLNILKQPSIGVLIKRNSASAISITIRHGSSPANLLHLFRTAFLKNTPGGLLLNILSLLPALASSRFNEKTS